MTHSNSDINLLIKPRNAHILRLMRGLGYKTVAAFCRAADMHGTLVGQFVNMTRSPISPVTGQWLKAAERIAENLNVTPDILWPGHMKHLRARKTQTELEVGLDTAVALCRNASNPANLLEGVQAVESLFGVLTVRERAIITMRMAGGTLAEVGRALGQVDLGAVTQERLRQIEANAHRKMRTAAKRKYGAECADDIWAGSTD